MSLELQNWNYKSSNTPSQASFSPFLHHIIQPHINFGTDVFSQPWYVLLIYDRHIYVDTFNSPSLLKLKLQNYVHIITNAEFAVNIMQYGNKILHYSLNFVLCLLDLCANLITGILLLPVFTHLTIYIFEISNFSEYFTLYNHNFIVIENVREIP